MLLQLIKKIGFWIEHFARQTHVRSCVSISYVSFIQQNEADGSCYKRLNIRYANLLVFGCVGIMQRRYNKFASKYESRMSSTELSSHKCVRLLLWKKRVIANVATWHVDRYINREKSYNAIASESKIDYVNFCSYFCLQRVITDESSFRMKCVWAAKMSKCCIFALGIANLRVSVPVCADCESK